MPPMVCCSAVETHAGNTCRGGTPMRLAGKVALITGAAAGIEGELMGFGGAAARLFAREGARVVLTDIKEEMGRKTAEQIQAQGGEAARLLMSRPSMAW